MVGLAPKWVRLAPNGTNPGLFFRSDFSAFGAAAPRRSVVYDRFRILFGYCCFVNVILVSLTIKLILKQTSLGLSILKSSW